jgi:hypothetical protein
MHYRVIVTLCHSLCQPPCSPAFLQVGACIVNDENIILSIGYNGFPRGCSDSSLPWSKKARSGSILDTKYPYVSGPLLGGGTPLVTHTTAGYTPLADLLA